MPRSRSSSRAWRSRSRPARRPTRSPSGWRTCPGLTVVTNSVRVADVLHQAGRADQTIILTGGVRTPVRCAGRPVRGGGAADRPRRPRVRRRPRDGSALGVHLPEPARGRHGPGAHRGRPPARRRRRPLEVGGHRDQLDRAARPGRCPRSPTPGLAPEARLILSGAVRELVIVDPAPAPTTRICPEVAHARLRPKTGRSVRPSHAWPANRTVATTRSSTSGSSCRPDGRGARGWAPRSRRRSGPGLAFDPDCYLCPGNTRANGDVNPAYPETFVFTNDFSALRPDTSIAVFDEGLLRAEGERGFVPRRLLLAAARPDPRPDGRAPPSGGSSTCGRTRPPSSAPSTAGSRSSRTVARRWAPPTRIPHGQIWAGTALPGRGAPARIAAQRAYLAATGRRMLLDYVDQEAGGQRVDRRDRRVADGRPVLGGLAVRDPARAETPRRPPDRARRRRSRRPGGRPPRAHRAVRRPVQAAVPVLDGLAPGAVR